MPDGPPDRLGARAGLAIVLVAAAAILFVTCFPFDFVVVGGPLDVFDRIQFDLSGAWLWSDVPLNVVLFVPLGLGVAVWCERRAWSGRTVIIAATTSGLLLSMFVELVQASMLERFPALSDVLANTLGAFLGAAASVRWGGGIARAARRVRGWSSSIPEVVQAGVALLPAAVVLMATAGVHGGADLPWDPAYRLALGNEATGDRPWEGTIGSVAFSDGSTPVDGTDGTADELFTFDAREGVPDGLRWRGGPGEVVDDGVVVGARGWLISEQPVREVSEAVAATGAVGVRVVASAARTDQFGPARIVSISEDPYHRNITLAQQGQALIVRVRTSATGVDGSSPQVSLPGVFDDDAPHVITVTSDGATVDVTVDGERSSIRLVPEAEVLLRLVAVGIDEIRISTIGPAALVVAYHALMLAPWGVYLAVRRARRPWWMLALLAVAVPVAVELALRAVSTPGAWAPSMIVVGIASSALGGLAVGAFRIVAPAPGRPPAPGQVSR